MGHMRHNAIIVTSWDKDLLIEAHTVAKKNFKQITPITPEAVNGYVSFLIAPDGSKEGWDHSDRGDRARATFLRWLNSRRYDDDSITLDWIEVQFGGDEKIAEILSHSGKYPGETPPAEDEYTGDFSEQL